MFVDISSKDPQTVENLGGKGFGLWQMTQNGLPVPPALVIPTSVCVQYMKAPVATMKSVAKALPAALKFFEDTFGYMPLLSVRSGARVSMPGMMDTILNVGLDDKSLPWWEKKLGTECATDSYERLIEMYGSVVANIERSDFEDLSLQERLELYNELAEENFPNAAAQLLGSIEAVFKSWDNDRANIYRKMNGIPHEWGTAVVLQSMVFGNLNDQSATGVLFTRNPDTGLAKVSGEFLVNAQGEDVVAGIKTPLPLEEMSDWNPTVHKELLDTVLALEVARKDVQDVEFTIQDGKLFILQTRNAKRSAQAAVRIALDMVQEDMLTPAEAVARVSREQYSLLQQPILDPKFTDKPMFTGIPACSGVAMGIVVMTSKDAINCKQPCILVTKETTPDDIGGMNAAVGVVTMQGGSTSHAAVVARGMNKPCIVGVGKDTTAFVVGQMIGIDGATGRIWKGKIPVIDNSKSEELAKLNQMLFEAAKCQLISSDPKTGCTVLDLTEDLTDLNSLSAKIKARLALPGDFIVDIALEEGEAEYTYYSLMCHPGDLEHGVVTHLSQLPEADRKRFRLLTSVSKADKVQLISKVSCLQELVLAQGSFVLDGLAKKPDAAALKVMEWKKQEGAVPMAFGVKTAGVSYLSHEQVVSALLR